MPETYLTDRFIDLDFYGRNATGNLAVDKVLLSVHTPRSGRKPTIAIDVHLIPGQSCYQCVVRVVNLNIPMVNLKQLWYVRIVAGYLNEYTATELYCPIFSAYVEKPNPDGITVFNCLCAGKVAGAFEPMLIPVRIYTEYFTWRTLIEAAYKKAGIDGWEDTIRGLEAPPGEENILDIPVRSDGIDNCYATSGYALFHWLGREIKQFAAGYVKKDNTHFGEIVYSLYNKRGVICFKDSNALNDDELIVDLNMVTSASFTGAKLTVEAPWNPALLPGGAFKMPASFYSAEYQYQGMSMSSYIGQNDYYRAITITISFNTTESTNSMSILAIPIQYVPSSFENVAPGSTADSYNTTADYAVEQYKQLIGTTFDSSDVSEDPLIIGTKPAVEKAAASFWNSTNTFGTVQHAFQDYSSLPSSNTWQVIAKDTFRDYTIDANGADQMNTALKNAGYSLRVTENMVIDRSLYWPIVVQSTYLNWRNADDKEGVFNFANPGQLQYYSKTMRVAVPHSASGTITREELRLNGGKQIMLAYYEHIKNNPLFSTTASNYLAAAFCIDIV